MVTIGWATVSDTSPTAELPTIEFAFPGPLRDALVEAVRTGRKTGSAALLAELDHHGLPLPEVGDRGIVVDSAGEPVCTIEVTDVQVVPISDVDDEHARSEGEDYSTADGWRQAHTEFWSSAEMTAELGEQAQIDGSTQVVLERFEVIA